MTDKKDNPLSRVTGTEGYVNESLTVKKGMANNGLVTDGKRAVAQTQTTTTFSSPVAPSFGPKPTKPDSE